MKNIKFALIGILFGIVLTKSEIISWFRIQEMFRFQGIHMYGVIGTAIVLGAIVVAICKHFGWKTMEGKPPDFTPKKMEVPRLLFGGAIFGLGWSMTGACPGPLYALLAQGVWVILGVIIAGIFGAFIYGAIRNHLPH